MQILSVVERALRPVLHLSGLESRWVATRVARQHLYDARGRGALPPVVILHGISSAATPFAPVIHHLRPHVTRVLAPDGPAHGFSDDPREALTAQAFFDGTAELLDRELTAPAIIVGNSLGGAMALNYALERPERVAGLLLASPAGAAMSAEDFRSFLARFELKTRDDALTFIRRLYHRYPWFAPIIAPEIQRLFGREHIRSLTATTTADDLFTPERIAALVTPVHLVWGRSDRLMPPENLAFYKRHLPPHATIEEPEGFGHCPHLDAPDRFAATILAFALRVVRGEAATGKAGPSLRST
jgi:pimeloyl-ACP methyl ester carboxylesterase